MLTKLRIRNFKRLTDIEFELGQNVVLVGPNNSGKTTALQALALWQFGLTQWLAKRGPESAAEKRPGVSVNRRDVTALPVPSANLLWRGLHVRNVVRTNGKQDTKNILVDIVVDGVTADEAWSCGLEFDYANDESFYCRPLRLDSGKTTARMPIPAGARKVKVAFLPPMSGLAVTEPKWERGRIDVLLGQGNTAEVLRNLCHQIATGAPKDWDDLVAHITGLFGVTLQPPQHVEARGEITMGYRDREGTDLDLSSSGRGLQQTLLLLAHLYANPGTVLLLDEPDAHLEILRQRQIYGLLTSIAASQGSQVIAATHSEVVLNEAADRDVVVAFLGKPHRIDDRGAQVRKSLIEIGFDHFYQAEQCGWVLYLEGSTDLAILQAFAATLQHPAATALARPFVHYVGNDTGRVQTHFWGLREAVPDLVGVALFDRQERSLPASLGAVGLAWTRREIENYFCTKEVLIAYAAGHEPDDLVSRAEKATRVDAMEDAIRRVENALKDLGRDAWSADTKASDDVLDAIFRLYFETLKLPMLFRKADYHELARFLPRDDIDPEISEKLDAIFATAKRAKPRDN